MPYSNKYTCCVAILGPLSLCLTANGDSWNVGLDKNKPVWYENKNQIGDYVTIGNTKKTFEANKPRTRPMSVKDFLLQGSDYSSCSILACKY